MKIENQYFVYLQTNNLKPVYSKKSRATGLYRSMTFILIVRFKGLVETLIMILELQGLDYASI